MHFEILNVGYASCAILVDGGHCALFDCGATGQGVSPYRRLAELGVRDVSWLSVSNYDEDHIAGLPAVRHFHPIRALERNASVSAETLRAIKRKTGTISPAMSELLGMIETYTGGGVAPASVFPRARWETFYNPYPSVQDTNGLSTVTFLDAGGLRVVLPGDLTAAGWRALLLNPRFRDHLAGVHVFVASHHGRQDGYCQEVFEVCSPAVVVVSDGPIRYTTQEMVATYARHASGVPFGGQMRSVLTTRCDSSIWWTT